jgi:short-subunit dehydrogenase
MELDGLTCLVTGANRGIGRAIAQRLAQEPVRVLAGVRRLDRWAPIGGDVEPVVIDLASRASIEAFDRDVDVLVNNAGQFTAGLLETQDVDAIYAMLQVNLLGTIHLTRHVLPGMLARGRGKIVINSSVVAYANFPAVTTYAASKAGISGFAEALRRELAPTPLSTLHIVTGGIDTDMLDETKAQLEPHFPGAERWDEQPPEAWAEKIVSAIAYDDQVLGPGGKAALGKLASHLPRQVLDGVVARAFSR